MTYLELKWTISRARDTYGYNILTLLDGKNKFRAKGGGYDMQGTVFADWLIYNYYDRLTELTPFPKDHDGRSAAENYGLFEHEGKIYLDGACGLESMIKLAEKIGLLITRCYRKRLQGFIILDTQGEKDD